MFGVRDPSWGIYGANKYLLVDDLIRATKVFAAMTMEWCGVAGRSLRLDVSTNGRVTVAKRRVMHSHYSGGLS